MPNQIIRICTGGLVALGLGCSGTRSSENPHPPVLSAPRSFFMGATLRDGRVLIAGGENQTGILATAEVYDPEINALKPTGTMSCKRRFGTATVLLDGKVLLAGGGNETMKDAATAELYDPSLGNFTPTGSMRYRRMRHSATLLPNGKVLIVGGGGDPQASTSAELYDPETNTFSLTGSMENGRELHSATLLKDGRVLIAGGWWPGGGPGYLSTAEAYVPYTASFTVVGPMATGRWAHFATLLLNGKVLATGGHNTIFGGLARSEAFDPATGTFYDAGNTNDELECHSATLLPDGRVLLAGGLHFTAGSDNSMKPTSLSATEYFDPVKRRFDEGPTLATPRHGHMAFLLTNGRVLLVGGQTGTVYLATTEFVPK